MAMTTKNTTTTNILSNTAPLLSQSSFAYAPSSPTISLLSSSSSSPSSSSSSPTQMSNRFDINNMNKKSALSNISAAIAKHQQQLTTSGIKPNNQTQTSNPNAKLISLMMDNGGVSCSVVKSNTNIYYNLKVDATTSKAIHYCEKCTNPDCKAIHKSLTRPLVSQSNQPGMTRIYLGSNLQPHQQIHLQPSHQNQNQQHNNNNSKLSGANINFIFERRYPLNSDLNNSGTSSQGSSQGSVSPNSQYGHGHGHPQRHIYIRPHGDDPNSSFPLPLSPQALHHAVAAAAALAHVPNSGAQMQQQNQDGKPAHFSINFNRLNNSALNQAKKRMEDFMDSKSISGDIKEIGSAADPFSLFPTLNLNSLRYKNTLFLDQVRKLESI